MICNITEKVYEKVQFLSDESPMLEISVLAVHQPFCISICISTLPMQHTTIIY